VAQVFVDDLDELGVSPEDAHHLTDVLRLHAGERVVAGDGRGGWLLCRYRAPDNALRKAHRDGRNGGEGPASGDARHRRPAGGSAEVYGLLEAIGPLVREQAPDPRVVVGFVPVKGDRPELIVQKLTELGVDTIALLTSARAVVRWDRERTGRVVARLTRVARGAAAQSRRAWLPEVVGPLSIAELPPLVAPAELALAHPGADMAIPGTTAVAVGPEGGWDEEELREAQVLLGLSPRILRSETAAIAAGCLLCALRDGPLIS
jgi:16S rRNA (uracil1498-N3)-methyltransferase